MNTLSRHTGRVLRSILLLCALIFVSTGCTGDDEPCDTCGNGNTIIGTWEDEVDINISTSGDNVSFTLKSVSIRFLDLKYVEVYFPIVSQSSSSTGGGIFTSEKYRYTTSGNSLCIYDKSGENLITEFQYMINNDQLVLSHVSGEPFPKYDFKNYNYVYEAPDIAYYFKK